MKRYQVFVLFPNGFETVVHDQEKSFSKRAAQQLMRRAKAVRGYKEKGCTFSLRVFKSPFGFKGAK